MKQKVWVIPDRDWNEPAKKSAPAAPLAETPEVEESTPQAESPRKNPALSFSLSLVVWGGGYRYLGEKRASAIYMAAMGLFSVLLWGQMFFLKAEAGLLARLGLTPAAVALEVAAFFFAGLILWSVNAVTAYFRTVRGWPDPFLGVEKGIWPLCASLFLPGWGQFLNGQPLKGLFFLLFGMLEFFTLFVFALTRSFWPLLQGDPARRIFEVYLGGAVLLLPLFLLAWIVAAYDAFRANQKQQRKRLCRKNPGYRPGGPKIARALIPRGSAILGLLLAISLGMQFCPKQFYRHSLERVRVEMLKSHVEVIPELVQKVVGVIDR